ncbi:MAG: hypothetical protein ABWY02_05165, partial [Telluria sp.]
WTESVPDSALDAYSWEVERPLDKRILRPDFLASDARAASVIERRGPGAATIPDPVPAMTPAPQSARYKLFVAGAQRGPFALDEVAQQLERGEIELATKSWNMAQDPRFGKWQAVADIPGLDALRGPAIPDPDDGIPDPQ